MWAYGWGSRRHRGLRVWVLQILERGPLNGAEIMEQMDRMTMGWWRPSPGSIYPLLEQLEQEKLVTKNADGRYRLTEAAKGGPDWMREFGVFGAGAPRDPQEALLQIESFVRFLEDSAVANPAQLGPLVPRLRTTAERLGKLAQNGKAM